MDFRIADTFTDSLARLTGDEQKLAKTTAFDLQLDPASPGMQFHRLSKSKDPNFWSVRVGSDLRLIVHRTASSLMLCYVDHHDAAYRWAERWEIERHPQIGAAQRCRRSRGSSLRGRKLGRFHDSADDRFTGVATSLK
jgi:mRNA-degrading endonuclease RelE of RelBE toxin-antitoxin system